MNISSRATPNANPLSVTMAPRVREIGGLAAITLALATLLGPTGCDEHFSTQEAYAACEKLAESGPPADTEAGFADCVACYEDCGNACIPSAEGYSCPAEEGEGGAATGGAAP